MTGVQNLKKKHRRLEAELNSHEPQIVAVQEAGQTLMDVSKHGSDEIRDRLARLEELWRELRDLSKVRERKLEESIVYQNFLARIDEEEAWVSEKVQVMSNSDLGQNMAAVQGLLKKHDAFETDLAAHKGRVDDIYSGGQELIKEDNHHKDSILQRCEGLVSKMNNLRDLTERRKKLLMDNSAFLQFMWKADVVESWIADKESYIRYVDCFLQYVSSCGSRSMNSLFPSRSDDFGRDLSSVQTLLTKQETFDIGLEAFENEGISNLTQLKDQLCSGGHSQSKAMEKKFDEVLSRWV